MKTLQRLSVWFCLCTKKVTWILNLCKHNQVKQNVQDVCVCVCVSKMSATNVCPAQNFYWFGKSKLVSLFIVHIVCTNKACTFCWEEMETSL